jgi:hypothetical protein
MAEGTGLFHWSLVGHKVARNPHPSALFKTGIWQFLSLNISVLLEYVRAFDEFYPGADFPVLPVRDFPCDCNAAQPATEVAAVPAT